MESAEHRFVIGRARECDIVLDDSSISRRHAELVLTRQGRWLLVDRQSQNGTSIREGDRFRSISQEVVTPSDTVQFGSLTITVADLLRRADFVSPGWPSEIPTPRRVEVEEKDPWVRGQRLTRCVCGAVKPQDGVCPSCGR